MNLAQLYNCKCWMTFRSEQFRITINTDKSHTMTDSSKLLSIAAVSRCSKLIASIFTDSLTWLLILSRSKINWGKIQLTFELFLQNRDLF